MTTARYNADSIKTLEEQAKQFIRKEVYMRKISRQSRKYMQGFQQKMGRVLRREQRLS